MPSETEWRWQRIRLQCSGVALIVAAFVLLAAGQVIPMPGGAWWLIHIARAVEAHMLLFGIVLLRRGIREN